ncbi:adenylyl-sulfate kinase [Metapseudomonas otitidis]|uniref:adenylyl-sulfate kinase n=1 Tax=Metapseudomonas otitidis TaxID=319939 RepID=UPI001FC9F5F5|nr:adenylyl-sulfate kinase [Pseudomonas otitidis]
MQPEAPVAGIKNNVSPTPAMTLWFTGLSGAGKSTLAQALHTRLLDQGRTCVILDGDHLRQGLNSDLGFSAVDRRENIRRVAEVAKIFNNVGVTVITALISPMADDRRLAKSIIGAAHFRELYICASLEVCEARDPKGLYAKARSGLIPDFTGICAPYEPPKYAASVVRTDVVSIDHAVEQLLTMVISSPQDDAESLRCVYNR